MTTKAIVIPKEDLMPFLAGIKSPQTQTYACLLYWLACRSGELLPYTHYKLIYKRDEQGKLVKDDSGNYVVVSKSVSYDSPGVRVSDIHVGENMIEFDNIPVFKSKERNKTKNGFVPRKNNPLFDNIALYINNRKRLQDLENQKALDSGSSPATVWLFEKEFPTDTNELFFWRFKKRLDRLLHKRGWSSHSLRKTRLTHAGNVSGDPYFVQELSGHASINMASEYVAKRKLFDSMRKYREV